jgi:hypothetical protein
VILKHFEPGSSFTPNNRLSAVLVALATFLQPWAFDLSLQSLVDPASMDTRFGSAHSRLASLRSGMMDSFFQNLPAIIGAAAQSNRSMIALVILVLGAIVIKIFSGAGISAGWRILALVIVVGSALGLFGWAIAIEKAALETKIASEKKELELKIIGLARAIQGHIRSRGYESAQKALKSLNEVAPTTGHTFYFQGELSRIVRPARDLSNPNVITAIDWFDRYLDDSRSAATLNSTRLDAQACYESAEGFCRQRGGWVAHLLANIFYGLSLEQDKRSTQRRVYLERAQRYVQLSARYYPDGFAASIQESGGVDDRFGTAQLTKLIQEGLAQH